MAQKLQLRDIKKIELTTSGSFTGHYYRQVEIIPEGGGWSCYQNKLAEQRIDKEAIKQPNSKLIITNIRDSTRQFIKAVSDQSLNQLLEALKKPFAAPNYDLFNISAKELKQQIDSAYDVKLNTAQKARFENIIDAEQPYLKEAFLKAMNPSKMSDRTFRQIVIVSKNNKSDTITAYSNTELYYLPWTINKEKSYNPRIAELFESVAGNEGFITTERAKLYQIINSALYTRVLEPQINWEDLKKEQPKPYASLNTSLTPSMFIKTNGNQSGFLISSLLPANLEIRFSFHEDSTLNSQFYNNYEKEITQLYPRGGFLFDYLKAHPTYVGRFYPANLKVSAVDQIKAVYPDIVKYDRKKILVMALIGDCYQSSNYDKRSVWWILPNGSAVLVMHNNATTTNADGVFQGFTEREYAIHHYSCIVFDKSGRRIAGDDSSVKIDSE